MWVKSRDADTNREVYINAANIAYFRADQDPKKTVVVFSAGASDKRVLITIDETFDSFSANLRI